MRVTQTQQWRFFESMLSEPGRSDPSKVKLSAGWSLPTILLSALCFLGLFAWQVGWGRIRFVHKTSIVVSSQSGDRANGKRLGEPRRGKLSRGRLASAGGCGFFWKFLRNYQILNFPSFTWIESFTKSEWLDHCFIGINNGFKLGFSGAVA